MTPRKIHYWLDEGILGEPIRWGVRGVPTLLSFQQVLRIRVLQRLRDDLGFTLRKSRVALQWIVEHVITDEWEELVFFRAPRGLIGLRAGSDSIVLPSGQMIFAFEPMEQFFAESHEAWISKRLKIADFPTLVSDPGLVGGAPVIEGTRIDTAFVAHLAKDSTLAELRRIYPQIKPEALLEAAAFEGIRLAA
jgi:uncharacterized protein (DUF433 family)